MKEKWMGMFRKREEVLEKGLEVLGKMNYEKGREMEIGKGWGV